MITGMMARRIGGAAVVENAWGAGRVSAPAVLSVDDRRLTADSSGTGNFANAMSNLALSGNCYFSVEAGYSGAGESVGVGVARESGVLFVEGLYYGQLATGTATYVPENTVYANAAVVGNDTDAAASPQILEFAVRSASGTVWIRRAGGAWIGGGDPASDTTPTATLTGSGDICVVATIYRPSASSYRYVEIHRVADITGTPPSGFAAGGWA